MSVFKPRDEGPAADAPPDTPTPAPESASGEGIPGDRGIPSINRARSLQSRMSSLLAMGLMGTLGVGLLTWYYAGALTRQSRAQHVAQNASKSKAQGEMVLPALGHFDPPKLAAADPPPSPSLTERALGPPPALPSEPAVPVVAGGATANPGVVTGAGGPGSTAPSRGELAFERRLEGPVFASESSARNTGANANRAPTVSVDTMSGEFGAQAASQDADRQPLNRPSELTALLKPSATPAVQARLLPTRRMLLAKGAFIDCTLETAIDSTLPGMTTCITATDTFSSDGEVVLIERGTKLVGETQGQVQQGAARLFVLWTEARTPTGVVIPLTSPGTDELGRSGLSGAVSRHFWDRFGAAILISVINGAVQSAIQSTSSSGSGTVILNPSGTQDVMTEVLKSTVNIAPTITKPQGDRIQILVARDLDFRSVYELRTVGNTLDGAPR